MLAVINTKSNFRNLNGKILQVHEVVGKRVTCLVFMPEFGRTNQVDFSMDECYLIKQYENQKHD
jgi:hypothetical protein